MGQQASKDELVYQQVNYANSQGIISLVRDGAGLEWADREGKTPLIVACMNPELFNVAKTLLELGANVNGYRRGRYGGTALHHAAKRGLYHTVKLLLSHGANALVMNDDCQTPLDVARVKGLSSVVREIEGHICLFSGWLREIYGPGFLEALVPQIFSRNVGVSCWFSWVVVVPCASRNNAKPAKLELAIYSNVQDAQPRTLITLWKANMEEPSFNQTDPVVIITETSHISRRWRRRRGLPTQRSRHSRIKLAPANERDKQPLQSFCNACKGVPQVMHPTFPLNTNTQFPTSGLPPPAPPTGVIPTPTAPPTIEDSEIERAINASIQSSSHPHAQAIASSSLSGSIDISSHGIDAIPDPPAPPKLSGGEWAEPEAGSVATTTPSAPLVTEELSDNGPIQYPSIDFEPVEIPMGPTIENPSIEKKEGDGGGASSCVICLDAPVEGACIPCGHMAGCMSCLNEIQAKKWGCPVCRANINQVVRLYAV